MQQQTSAGIIVYTKKNNELLFLLLHYADGHWDFAKGHLENNETFEEAAHRELKEETGLTATINPDFSTKFSYNFTDQSGEKINKTVHFFTGPVDSEDVVLSHEHKDFIWLPFKQAYEKLTYDNAKSALKKVYSFLKEEKNKA